MSTLTKPTPAAARPLTNCELTDILDQLGLANLRQARDVLAFLFAQDQAAFVKALAYAGAAQLRETGTEVVR